MKKGRVSQTALKVALSLVTLNEKDDWSDRLPEGLVELSERLLVASEVVGYGPGTIRASKKPWMIRLYGLQETFLPGQFEGFGHRKVFMHEQVEAAIQEGARQVLVIGAGFDTLCLRLAPKYDHVQFFEVDHPATSAAKAKGVEKEASPANFHMIAADLAETKLSKVLAEDGRWRIDVPAVLVSEGLFQYLGDEEVRELMDDTAVITCPGSRFAFSHAVPGEHALVRILTRMIGEPWKSSVRSEDIPKYIEGSGWEAISEVDTNEAHGQERYAVAERR